MPQYTKLESGHLRTERKGCMMLSFMPSIGERKYNSEKKQYFALSATEIGALINLGPGKSCEFFHDPSMKSRYIFYPCNEMRRYKLDSFVGLSDPKIVKDWMKQVEKIFMNMGCPDEEGEVYHFSHEERGLKLVGNDWEESRVDTTDELGKVQGFGKDDKVAIENGVKEVFKEIFCADVVNNSLKTNERLSVPVTKPEFTVLQTTFSFMLPYLLGWDHAINRPPSTVAPRLSQIHEWEK
ncbi:hypothetical protein GIB67_023419 [Kingdonia uniflora]|uniref:Uncharacterized protein n=1 Tax=Kingdonia uniflora TaxID=39325 RepID=A0A7J7L1A1_9MAGN|nr:hypothetical protein GIB67_023419 [Kingdonia uniflora]